MANAGWSFDNTYARLPEVFFAKVSPAPVKAPKLIVFNHALAKSLGLNQDELAKQEAADYFSGNKMFPGSEPIAQAYAGHQYGHFTMLGDGRAHLLGEHITPKNERFDIQLKGSGQTPFSRRGDGRAALGPMLREYIISEAMHALGIPTTRGLAVVTTGEPVFREKPLDGAILTRVAASHIRVGTVEYAAALEEGKYLRTLADYTIQRHYPTLQSEAEPYLALLRTVMEKQAALVAKWMHVGFVHGVMNTDNMALSGETIDFGPCAFMDQYSPTTVFSSIDRNGRYAFGNQARIAGWNLARLAEALLPLFAATPEAAAEKAKATLSAFPAMFQEKWLAGMREKLGIASVEEGDTALIEELLTWMEKNQADYTNTFRALSSGALPSGEIFQGNEFQGWASRWRAKNPDFALMQKRNPVVIPRNHKVEEALAAADRGDLATMHRLVAVLQDPFSETAENAEYRVPPAGGNEGYQTFCGT